MGLSFSDSLKKAQLKTVANFATTNISTVNFNDALIENISNEQLISVYYVDADCKLQGFATPYSEYGVLIEISM